MIFDSNGLPKDEGASDLQDSSRLAGIMELFDFPNYINLALYVVDQINMNGLIVTRTINEQPVKSYVRHPDEYRYDFSRDQTLCFIAGLWRQKKFDLVDIRFVNGKDWFSPSHKGHILRCQNKKSNVFQNLWLKLEVMYSAHFKKLDEPNQLLAMMVVAHFSGEKSYLQYWLRHNEKWRESIHEYWSKWRGESKLADHTVKFLESL